MIFRYAALVNNLNINVNMVDSWGSSFGVLAKHLHPVETWSPLSVGGVVSVGSAAGCRSSTRRLTTGTEFPPELLKSPVCVPSYLNPTNPKFPGSLLHQLLPRKYLLSPKMPMFYLWTQNDKSQCPGCSILCQVGLINTGDLSAPGRIDCLWLQNQFLMGGSNHLTPVLGRWLYKNSSRLDFAKEITP